ncbi:MAG: hypothetical protein ACRDMX_15760 [Solirubrobacteraceae bacterium]
MSEGVPDRREAVAEMTEEGLSTREIGDVLARRQGHGAQRPSCWRKLATRARACRSCGGPDPEPALPTADELIADGHVPVRP